ncbi:hypothetical protein PPGU19_093130 (plasmid) [Paraburkholderia sp. PGU19]|uniref:hypothetical protein n=1 Tax=Paraburkholderia sp. PGU19 TaxID=2735434 RepID=UPI0015DCC754|nr:hypothetical protein [Paraburkholderia sp. PGU19]BCG04745.1 hypothetical protein PPGU19_093130 [Paraburkholderia sp. PGU19]
MLAIDQDGLGLQGLLVAQAGGLQVWAKLLAGAGQRAVVLFNNSATDAPMAVTWDALGFAPSSQATVRDVWARKDLGRFTASYTAPDVPAGGVTMLTVSGTDTGMNKVRANSYHKPRRIPTLPFAGASDSRRQGVRHRPLDVLQAFPDLDAGADTIADGLE